jgi:hypothetical protein
MSEQDDRRALRVAIARITLLSQVPAATLERSSRSTDDEIGGRRPKGGIIAKDDFEPEFALKSSEYFVRRLRRCHTERAITELLTEALATLEAWQRAPIPKGQEPEYGSPQWKRYIAESTEDAGALATRFHCTRRYINLIRQAYRQEAA